MKNFIIAIDGPAGSGKTTTAKNLSEKLGFLYIDTGAMYRAVTLAWLRTGKEFDDSLICDFLDEISIELKNSKDGQRTFLNGEDVSEEIRTPEVTKLVSPVSAVKCVRVKLVEMQRVLGSKGPAVLDGRDIGTVVFPDADLKIFLIASPEARARRRTLEMMSKGMKADEKEILEQIQARDKYDSTRKESPLKKADDAIEIDTSDLTIDEQTEKVYQLALNIINN